MRCSLLAVALLFACVALAQDAQLVLRKKVHQGFEWEDVTITKEIYDILNSNFGVLGQGHNVTVQLTAYNIGGGDAYEVTVTDSWSDEQFEIASEDGTTEGSQISQTWDVIPAGEERTLNVSLTPSALGQVIGSRAKLTYKSDLEADAQQVAYSTPMFNYQVVPKTSYDKLFDRHLVEWSAVGLAVTLILFVPYSLFHSADTEMSKLKKQA